MIGSAPDDRKSAAADARQRWIWDCTDRPMGTRREKWCAHSTWVLQSCFGRKDSRYFEWRTSTQSISWSLGLFAAGSLSLFGSAGLRHRSLGDNITKCRAIDGGVLECCGVSECYRFCVAHKPQSFGISNFPLAHTFTEHLRQRARDHQINP